MDPVALELLERYPLPTGTGTANNFRRVATEAVDQNQLDLRVDHRFASANDQVFARLSHFNERFVPVTPLPDGSGVTSGTLGPQRTKAWSFASSYQRTFSGSLLNELRVGDTRRSVTRDAAQLPEDLPRTSACRVFPLPPCSRTRCPPFRSPGISSLVRRPTPRRTSARA